MEGGQRIEVARHSIVCIVAPQLSAQRAVLLLERPVPIEFAPLVDGFQCTGVLARRYHFVVRIVSLRPAGRTLLGGHGFLLFAPVTRCRLFTVETSGPLKFLRNPHCAYALFFDPGRTGTPGHYDAPTWPPPKPQRGLLRLAFVAQSHGFNTGCLRLAGWVTPPPRKTRFRSLAKRFRAGLVTCRVPTKGFRVLDYILFLLSQACLTQGSFPRPFKLNRIGVSPEQSAELFMITVRGEQVEPALVLAVKQAEFHLFEAIVTAGPGRWQGFRVADPRPPALSSPNGVLSTTFILFALGHGAYHHPVHPGVDPRSSARTYDGLVRRP